MTPLRALAAMAVALLIALGGAIGLTGFTSWTPPAYAWLALALTGLAAALVFLVLAVILLRRDY
jgi:hypothetical protein